MKNLTCNRHPKYTGKKIPKYECTCCLSIYFKLHSAPRAPIKPTKVIKDKTKYIRKTKHRKKDA